MFRKFSLFDSSPPPAKISIAPPKSKVSQKTPIKCAIISTPEFKPTSLISKQPAKRSKSLDHSNDKKQQVFQYHSAYCNLRSATLPPIIKELPQSPTTTSRWYSKLGSSFRKGLRRGGGRGFFQYHVKFELFLLVCFLKSLLQVNFFLVKSLLLLIMFFTHTDLL